MANVIRNKRGTTKPLASDIVTGEIAVKTDDAKLYIENDSGHVFEVGETLGTYSSSIITYTVTVASKTSAHRYNGTGSSSGYKINGIFAPFLSLTPGNTYRFDQSDSSNYGHPLRFYLEADKTTEYTTNVTTNATAGASSNAYVQIVITDATPIVLHYQCSSHGYMGNSVTSNGTSIDGSNVISGTIAAARIATLNQNTTGTSGGFTAGSASNLNTGTLPNDRFPATLPAISGENLTNLPFALSSDAQDNTVAGTYAGESFSGTNAQNNTLIGRNAGRYITTADHVVAVGRNAGVSITTNGYSTLVGGYAGESNTASEISAFGFKSLQNNTTGTKNSGFGFETLKTNQDGTNNTAGGYRALREQTTGTDNSAYGCEAGRNITTGIDNTCLGSFAGDAITTGSNNLVLGHEAAASAVDVSNEITLGNSSITKFRVPGVNFVIKDSTATEDYVLTCDANGEASWEAAQTGGGGANSDARFNTLSGTSAGASLQSNPSNSYEAKNNTFFGYQTATAMTTGYENVAMGYRSMYNTTIGGRTIAIGNETIYTSTKYDGGVIIGYKAGRELDGSTGNAANAVAIGHSAMGRIEEGGYNAVAIGQEALYGASGSNGGGYSVAIGQAAQKNITSGYRNASVGNQSMENVTTGYQNSAFGTSSLQQLTTGTLNTAAGNQAGFRVTTGSNNILIGESAGEELTTGSYNTIIGAKAGEAYSGGDPDLTTGTGNILIGARTVPSSSSVNYEVTIGSVNINKFRVPGINFILKDNGGTPTEGHVLTVDANGEAGFAAASGGGLTSDSDENTIGGTNAGDAITAGQGIRNTLIGYDAGTSITTGDNSTALGTDALKSVTTAYGNTGIGKSAGDSLTTGQQNTCIGLSAGHSLTTQSQNVCVGEDAMAQTKGANNTSVGFQSMSLAYFGDGNVALGNKALYVVGGSSDGSGGDYNVAIGYQAGDALETGSNCIIIGKNAAATSDSTSNEITLGNTDITKFRVPGIDFVLKDNGGTPTEGHVLTVDANGEASFAAAAGGGLDSDAKQNTLAGTSAGSSVSGSMIGYNSFFGYEAGKDYAGTRSTAVGHGALKTNYNGGNNTAIGATALNLATGSQNTAVGANSALSTTSGGSNTFVGAASAYFNTTGADNTVVGMQAFFSNTTGSGNTTLGKQAGKDITTGSNNTLIGTDAGNSGTNDLTTGSNNILIGHDAAASSATVSNEVTIGDSSISTIRCNTQTISSLSDRRDKTDINILDLGLDFVKSLNPVKFKWETRDGNGKDGSYEAGFIAQDFQQLQKENDADYLGLVMDENPDRLEASYGKLVPILVKAIQELTIEVEKLKLNG